MENIRVQPARIYTHARELLEPTAPPRGVVNTNAFNNDRFIKVYLAMHPAVDNDLWVQARAQAASQAHGVGNDVAVGAGVGGVMGMGLYEGAILIGIVAGGGPVVLGVGAGGAAIGAAAGWITGRAHVNRERELAPNHYYVELTRGLAGDRRFIRWKNEMRQNETADRYNQILDRVDLYMLQLGIVPQQFRCHSSRKVLRSVIKVGASEIWEASIITRERRNEAGELQLEELVPLGQPLSKGVREWLVEKDVWRLRARFLEGLIGRDGSDLARIPRARRELDEVYLRCQDKETNAIRRIPDEAQEATADSANLPRVEVTSVPSLLLRARSNHDFYVSLGERGEEIHINLPGTAEELPEIRTNEPPNSQTTGGLAA
jgi:hypothetical protein